MSGDDKLCFLVSWEDKVAGVDRHYHLYFYPKEKCVEMMDIKLKKIFLKKCQTNEVNIGKNS